MTKAPEPGSTSAGGFPLKTGLEGTDRRVLVALLAAFAATSLVHFAHNAVYLGDYPNLPESWTSAHVYVAWIAMTLVGLIGWLLVVRGFLVGGLVALAVYATLGLDSLGHYVLAPMSSHTVAMNATILAEVTAAGCLLLAVARQLARHVLARARGHDV